MDKWESLRQKCPLLFKHAIPIECQSGWFGIIYGLSKKIEQILEKHAENHKSLEGEENEYIEMFAIQVKEKYGKLGFYMSCETDEITGLIQEAEELSAQTCEICGCPGRIRTESRVSTECDSCFGVGKK
jgi:hypothetical protein